MKLRVLTVQGCADCWFGVASAVICGLKGPLGRRIPDSIDVEREAPRWCPIRKGVEVRLVERKKRR